MAFTTYDELIEEVKKKVIDESVELDAYLPTAVQLAEDRLFLMVDQDYTKETTLTATIGSPTVAKPADYRVTNNMYLVANNTRTRLIKKTEDFLKDYWPSTTLTEAPKYYAEQDQTNFRLAPTPDAAYSLLVEYEYRPIYLSSANPTNLWMTRYPALLFHAVLMEVASFMGDSLLKADHEGMFNSLLTPVQVDTDRFNRDDNAGNAVQPAGRNRKSV